MSEADLRNSQNEEFLRRNVKVHKSETGVVVDLSGGDMYIHEDIETDWNQTEEKFKESVETEEPPLSPATTDTTGFPKMSATKKRRIDEILNIYGEAKNKMAKTNNQNNSQQKNKMGNGHSNGSTLLGISPKPSIKNQIFKFYSKEALANAINCVEEGRGSIAEASIKFGVPHIALQNKLRESADHTNSTQVKNVLICISVMLTILDN